MLYRIYRPKTFEEIEGQEHVVQTIQGALSSNRVGHAYFFAGPRGTGKTTMARLFAKMLNCEKRKINENSKNSNIEPCNKCFSCTEINAGKSLDLIEIDAASNRGIDEIRNLKESAGVSASSSTYKIFIIDEVHMLTTPAFNALLKTLEEPPSQTIFILATTEPHKVPETILSRVQRFDFKKIPDNQIIAKLKKIAKSEKLNIDDSSLELVAQASGGSLRDAESALAKVMAFAGSKITEEKTSSILGIIPKQIHQELLKNLQEKKTKEAIIQISTLFESGVNLEHFTKQFIEYVRTTLVSQLSSTDPKEILYDPNFLVLIMERFIKARSEYKYTPIPQLPLELAVVELTKTS